MIYKINKIIKIYKIINDINKEKLYSNVLVYNNKTIKVYNFFSKIILSIKINQVIKKINISSNNNNKIQILKKINNYLKENIEFDKEYSLHLDPKRKLVINKKLLRRRTAYNALVHKKCACMGYSETLRILLCYFNIESKTILSILPQKEIDVIKYKEQNKSYYYDHNLKKYYPLSIYKPLILDNIIYKGFAHYSTIVYIEDKKIILDPDRQRDREKKKIEKKDIIYELKSKIKYLKEIPDNYDPITEKLLGSELKNINFKIFKNDQGLFSILEL